MLTYHDIITLPDRIRAVAAPGQEDYVAQLAAQAHDVAVRLVTVEAFLRGVSDIADAALDGSILQRPTD